MQTANSNYDDISTPCIEQSNWLARLDFGVATQRSQSQGCGPMEQAVRFEVLP